MTVKEIIQELEKYPDEMKVFTKKTEAFGNIGCTFSVKEDKYSSFGVENPCVIISDMTEGE